MLSSLESSQIRRNHNPAEITHSFFSQALRMTMSLWKATETTSFENVICLSGPAPTEKIFRCFFAANQRRNRRHPVPIEGASAVVTDVGAGRGGRVGSQ